MPSVTVNGVDLYYEETGDGVPLLLLHEFAGDCRSWEPQVRYFARRYRVITFNFRGYPPSTVPTDPAEYSEELLVEDTFALIRQLGVGPAHVCGLSMGGNATLKLGIAHPEVCRSLVVGGAGYGSTNREQFVQDAHAVAALFERDGADVTSGQYARGPSRQRFILKDPRGWSEFRDQLASHSGLGSALTQRGVQARRRTIFDIADEMPSMQVPTLVVTGDEDDLCLEPAILMKRRLPNAGLAVFPNTGHTVNLEEPDLFNRTILDFITAVDEGKWHPRPTTDTSMLPSDS